MKKLYFLILSLLVSTLSFGQTTDLLFSMYGEGSSNNKFLEIYNGTGADVDLGDYSISTCSNGCDTANEFDFPDSVTFTPGTMLADGDVFVIAHPSADGAILAAADLTFQYLSNGDDTMALTLSGATADTYTIIDILGDMSDVDGDGWDVAGITNATYNNTFTRKTSVCSPNPNELGSFGTDAATSEWIVTGSNTGWGDLGTYTGCISDPVITITSPSDNESLASGTTNATISIDVQNFVIGNPGGGIDGHIHWTVNGASQPMKYDTSDESIPVADGGTYTVVMTLVDNTHTPIVPEISDTVTFTVAYPCDLQVGTITSTCDAINPGAGDTYTTTIDFTGGGTSQYTIDTQGIGVVTGENPTDDASGTIIISNIPENTDFVVTFTGDPGNSSCDFTRNIDSPDCDPALTLPLYDNFDYPDGSLIDNPNWDNFSGTEGDLLVASGKALVQHGAPSEDASIAFANVSGNIYYAFDLSVNDPGAPISGGDYEYFAMFKDNGFTYRARLDIVEANSTGDYTIGLSSTGSTADAVWATDLNYGATYRVTVRYDQALNIAELWVDASSESDTSILGTDQSDPGTDITQFALRQSDSSDNEGILVDNLAITQTFNETLSTTNHTLTNDFAIYPNPTSTGSVSITSTNSEAISVNVFDILGKQVLNANISNNTLDVSSLNAGVYLVKLTQNNATVTKKLVIK